MLNRLSDALADRVRLADRPLAIKVAAAPGLMLVLFALLAALSMAGLLLTSQSIDRIVRRDMRDVAGLNAVASRFEGAELALYRLLVTKATTPETEVPPQVDSIKARLTSVRADLLRYHGSADARSRPALTTAIAELDRYASAVDVVTSMLEVDFASSANMLAPFHANARQVEQRIKEVAEQAMVNADTAATASALWTRMFLSVLVLAVVIATLIGLFVSYAVGRATVGSITRIAQATQAIMNEEQVELAALRRRDELGGVVAALEAFVTQREETRALAQRATALQREAQLEEKRRADELRKVREDAERDRQATLATLAQAFDEKLAAVIREAQQAMHDLDGNAAALDETARSNQQLADKLDEVATLLARDMDDASAAARSLARAFHDIDREVADTSAAARAINDHAQSAREAVTHSQDEAAAIGRIVDVIAAVARQTNLLALNATIEASRVGAVGDGFAVVAGEIKSLANHTASSTGDVRRQIEAMQRQIDTVVGSTDNLSALIAGMDDASDRVAQMSNGQASSTEKLDSLINTAHERSATVTYASESINHSARQNHAAVQQLRRASAILERMLETLARDAQAFTRQLKAG